eukprot:365731-Chlamydomonas_euryale.AAC.7
MDRREAGRHGEWQGGSSVSPTLGSSHRNSSITKFLWTCKQLWKAERHQRTRLAGGGCGRRRLHPRSRRGSPMHAGHSLGGTAQFSGRRQDRIKPVIRGGPFHWENEANRAAVDNAAGVVAAFIWEGGEAPKTTTLERWRVGRFVAASMSLQIRRKPEEVVMVGGRGRWSHDQAESAACI